MKNKFTIIIAFIFVGINAQLGIETESVRGDGLMDFPSPATKGILIPKVTNSTSTAAHGGSIIYDVVDQRVEYYNPSTSAWEAMTKGSATAITGADTASYPETNPDNGIIVIAGTVLSEEEADDAVIGALVVKSNDKALILPQVTDAT